MGRLVLAVAGVVAAACGTLLLRKRKKKVSEGEVMDVPVRVKRTKRRHAEVFRFPDTADSPDRDGIA
jgi:hypothetical protein